MNFTNILPLCAAVLVAAGLPHASIAQETREHQLKLDLDALLAVPTVWGLTAETLPKKCPAEGFRSNPFFVWSGSSEGAKDRAIFSRKPYNNIKVDLTLFGGTVPVEQAVFEMKDGKVASVQVTASAQNATPDALAQWKAACESAASKTAGGSPMPGARLFGFKAAKNVKTMTWAGPTGVAALDFSAEDKVLGYSLAPAGTSVGALLARPLRVPQAGEELFVNLDPLLALPTLWSLTPDKLEADFAISGFKESPFYQWLTADKSGVRFSKHPYSNINVDLNIFDGSVSADELVIEFTGGKATRASISLFNRGDSGEIARPEFERRFKSAGVSMGKLLGVRPTERKPSAQTVVKISGWIWTGPTALASLEYNTEALSGGAAEFLRLKLAEPSARDAFASESGQSIRSNALGKAELPKFVKRESNGDVYVSGVPMVDQGDKGYCVVAACQRLFSYLRIPVDQHELAQIAGSDATRGTNSQEIDDTLKKIDSRFKVKYKPLAYRYTSGRLGVPYGNRVNDVDADKFTKSVEDYTSKGIPMLWALELGRFPEEPANAAQAVGGHMRLIIGANSKTGDVLFTDSWGAGHELKRMKMGDAYRATTALWIIEPKEH
ncbi:MAG: C39 family peptidase [Roseimicrobium sp.]